MENTRPNTGQRDSGGRSGGGPRHSRFKKRVCRLCQEDSNTVEYKNVDFLVRFVSNKGKILPRRLSGSCAKHQRLISKAIKISRTAGFLPYSAR